jgi:trans-aconitate 2-methyltransferase
MNDWNPQQYLKFKSERTQPSIDLVARIMINDPETIVDIGCGPGNSTQILHRRWPDADIVGLDSSQRMIEKAREDYPSQKWMVGDASDLDTNQKYDIVFSNATLQWVPNHDVLIPRLFNIVNKNGVLAVQVPANNESPIHKVLLSVAQSQKWKGYTSSCEKLLTYHNVDYYYNVLISLTENFDIWETTYYHVLKSHETLIEWYKSTGMKPFLERLPNDEDRAEFQKEILMQCKSFYPIQTDGKILYPFKRLFFTANKSND